MRKQKKKAHLKTKTLRQGNKQRIIDIRPEDFAHYLHQAEPQALSIIKELEVSPGAAILLLAQYTQTLISGNSRITLESATTITDSVLALWQAGLYHPSEQYPFTLEETLQDLKEGVKAKVDYSTYIQPFTLQQGNTPIGIGRLAAGIALHPKNLLWQVWIIAHGPCALLGAYRDPTEAQKCLERIINIARYGEASVEKHGDAASEAWNLYQEIISQGDGKPLPFPYDMMTYLIDHTDLYTVEL